jgi:flagellar protein FliJ
MPDRFPLQVLLDHATHRLEAAERLLRMLRRKEDEVRRRLDDLRGYRQEYQARLAGQGRGGMHIQLFQDYHAFLGKLEGAVGQQEAELAQAGARWQQAHENWMALRQQVKAYETLAKRHAEAEGLRQERQEQRLTDEQSSIRGQVEAWLGTRK